MAPIPPPVGAYGLDLTMHSTWAVLNHNIDYSVVPEPSTWALMAVGFISLFVRRQRRGQIFA